uniref:gluconate 2-dehydrogenase subunit 3 family protein n=1 Tax=uncultured Altererythrobacter sp. TaxID=500840 RepID=UPI00261E27D0|nr:gluconate 2-dehydrogenase subunit 3 family protein [uncultured Altererythrobacter sp.]
MSIFSDVASLIVGEGDWPSVEDTRAVRFIDGMIEEWAGPKLKARLTRLPGQLDRFAEKLFKRSYAFLEREKREQVLSEFDALAFSKPQLEESIGYREFKTLLLKVHLSSAEANRDFVRVPGTYHGDLSADQYFEMIRDKAESFAG